MKRSIKTIAMVALSFTILQSCGSSNSSDSTQELKDEQLSSFMLGGIYAYNGYGGIDAIVEMMKGADYTSDKELVNGYKEVLEFPFETSQASGIKSVFESMWEISNKEELLESLDELKTREHPYKAWDYARIINNTNMGYACGFLTKEEATKINAEILPLAREKFKTWDDYFTDFNKGRIDWNSEDPEGDSFEELSSSITKYENSIYKILPLNTNDK